MRQISVYIVSVLAALLALQAVYVAYVGPWDIAFGRNAVVCVAVIIALVSKPAFELDNYSPRVSQRLVGCLDLVLIFVILAASVRFTQVAYLQIETLYIFSEFDLWLSLAGCGVLLEATRRLFGLPIVIIALLALIFCFVGEYLPGVLKHNGVNLDRAMQTIWYGYQGVFGTPTGVVLRVVLIFVVFGGAGRHRC